MKKLVSLLFLAAGFSGPVFAQDSLENQLGSLKIPDNVAPVGISQESLYSVQSRYSSLRGRMEVAVGGAQNFTGNSFIKATQLDLAARYHLNDRFNLGLGASFGFNSFTDSAYTLMTRDNIVPDAAIVKWRANLMLGYNVFYGKFRLNMDQVLYFDQYVSVGPGLVNTQYNTALAAVADIGIAFWFGRDWTARFGFKNEFFNEKTRTGSGFEHHLLGHLDVGYLFGEGKKI